MIPSSDRVLEQDPDWFLVAREACNAGTPDLGFFSGVSVFIGSFGVGFMSGESRDAHEGGGAPTPLGSAPCLVSTPEVDLCTPCTHIYLRTLKLPEQKIDREFRRRKPL